MDAEEAVRLIGEAVQKRVDAGLAVTGELVVDKPRESYLLFTTRLYDSGHGVYRLAVEKSSRLPPQDAAVVLEAYSTRRPPELAPGLATSRPCSTGETCSTCGSGNLVRSGTCETCLDCGSTTGCG